MDLRPDSAIMVDVEAELHHVAADTNLCEPGESPKMTALDWLGNYRARRAGGATQVDNPSLSNVG
ncbi:hypothetical protein GCM10009860_05950 [Microbacterium mitrae]